MLTPHGLNMPLPPLSLLLEMHRLRINPHNPRPTLEQSLIDIRRPLKREIARPEQTRPVQPDDVPRLDVGHQKGQTELVTGGHEVGSSVQVHGDVVHSLGCEVRQHLEEGARDFQGAVEGRGQGLLVQWHVVAGLRRDEGCCW